MHVRRLAFAFATCLLLAACGREGGEPNRLETSDAGVLATGQRLYAQHCAACHGAKLEGQPRWRERDASGRLPAPPHDESGHTWHHPDQVLFDITKHGVAKAAGLQGYDSAMPAFEGVLSDAQIVAVLAWIRSTWPPAIQHKQAQVNEAALKNRAAQRP